MPITGKSGKTVHELTIPELEKELDLIPPDRIKEYLVESFNNDWEGFSPIQKVAFQTLLRDMVLANWNWE